MNLLTKNPYSEMSIYRLATVAATSFWLNAQKACLTAILLPVAMLNRDAYKLYHGCSSVFNAVSTPSVLDDPVRDQY